MKQNKTLPIYGDEIRRDLSQRLTRVEGQLRGIARMLEQDRPCLEVLQQLAMPKLRCGRPRRPYSEITWSAVRPTLSVRAIAVCMTI